MAAGTFSSSPLSRAWGDLGQPRGRPQPPDGGARPALGERHRAPPGAPRRCRPPRGPTTPPGEGPDGRAPLPPRGARGQGLRRPPHSPRPAGMEGQLGATSFADDVLRVFGANHSLSAGQLSALLQRLGAAPALGSELPLAHLHHNQVPAPRGIFEGSGLGTSRSEGAGPAGQLRSVLSLTRVFSPHGEAGKEGGREEWGQCLVGLWARVGAEVPVRR